MDSAVVAYRIEQVEHKVTGLDKNKAEAADLHQIAQEVRSLRKTLIGFVIGVATSTVMVCITIIFAAGQHAFA